jgi:hypothetical protein
MIDPGIVNREVFSLYVSGRATTKNRRPVSRVPLNSPG